MRSHRAVLLFAIAASYWLWTLRAASFDARERIVYAKVGQDVVLGPGVSSEPGSIENILWKHEKDLAMEWYRQIGNVTGYRHFEERGHLNPLTGEMKIKQLILSDSGLYTPSIDNRNRVLVRLIVLTPVPKPTVAHSCDEEKTGCTFTCVGNTGPDAGPVTYNWKRDEKTLGYSSETLSISKDDDCFDRISCMLENPVSGETSEPYKNPLTPCAGGSHQIYTAFAVLGTLVLLIVGILIGCRPRRDTSSSAKGEQLA